jgi:hypothetical protein
MKLPTSYADLCRESVEKLENEIDVLTSISGSATIPAWMVKDLVAKAHYQGTLDCYEMFKGDRYERFTGNVKGSS